MHTDVRVMRRDGFTHLFGFALWSKNNRLEISAASESERQAWLSMINKVCKKEYDSAADMTRHDGFGHSLLHPKLTDDFRAKYLCKHQLNYTG